MCLIFSLYMGIHEFSRQYEKTLQDRALEKKLHNELLTQTQQAIAKLNDLQKYDLVNNHSKGAIGH